MSMFYWPFDCLETARELKCQIVVSTRNSLDDMKFILPIQKGMRLELFAICVTNFLLFYVYVPCKKLLGII